MKIQYTRVELEGDRMEADFTDETGRRHHEVVYYPNEQAAQKWYGLITRKRRNANASHRKQPHDPPRRNQDEGPGTTPR